MRKAFSKIKNFVKNNKWWSLLIVIVLFAILYLSFGRDKTEKYNTVTVQKHNIVEEISSTGNVKPLSDLELSFESGGQVSSVDVSVGEKVYQGQRLSMLSNADLVAAVDQAKAGLKIAEANLSSLKKGSTPQQIAVYESQVTKAENDVRDAKNALVNSIRDAYTKTDDAVRNYTDIIFENPRSANAKIKFETDFQLENNINNTRVEIETFLTKWSSANLSLTIESDLDTAVSVAKNNLNIAQTFLQNLAYATSKLLPTSSITEDTITIWKANISAARSNVSLALSNLSTVYSQYKSSVSTLDVSNSQLTLSKTGATIDDVSAQEAVVEQAEANLNAAKARLAKSIIYSPINGVVTKIDAKIGQTIQSGVPAISIISYGQYQVDSYIPEADIAKIQIGQRATTTLDAYGTDEYFETVVIKIDPAETVLSGVPTYKVTFKFASSSDSRIKSGMTANLDILTGQKNDVISVPSRSVFTKNSTKFVKLVDKDNKLVETAVTTGLRGVDGFVEITSGLKEGDIIVSSSY